MKGISEVKASAPAGRPVCRWNDRQEAGRAWTPLCLGLEAA